MLFVLAPCMGGAPRDGRRWARVGWVVGVGVGQTGTAGVNP